MTIGVPMKPKKSIEHYRQIFVGKNKVEIFTERVESECLFLRKYEFAFEVNGKTDKTKDFNIADLYNILKVVQKSLFEFIDDIMSKNSNCQLIIESEGNNAADKEELYEYQLARLASKLTRGSVICTHVSDKGIHSLNLTRLDNSLQVV